MRYRFDPGRVHHLQLVDFKRLKSAVHPNYLNQICVGRRSSAESRNVLSSLALWRNPRVQEVPSKMMLVRRATTAEKCFF